MGPFRELLKPGNSHKGKIYWDDNMDAVFEQAKTKICKAMEEGVRMFDPSLPTAVSTDFSKTGLGNTLSQKHCQCPGLSPRCCPTGWKLVAFSSKFTHPAEKNYSPVEGEALSAAVGLKKFRHFILGCDNLLLVVDHKPLVRLLGDKSLESVENERLKRLKEKTFPFKFKVVHLPGRLHSTPDAGSWYPFGQSELFLDDDANAINALIEDVEVGIHGAVTSVLQNVKTITWNMVQQATSADPLLSQLRDILQ